MIRIEVKYLDEATPRILDFSLSTIKDEQAIVDILNYPRDIGRFPYDVLDDNFDDTGDLPSVQDVMNSRLDVTVKEFLVKWLTNVYNQGVEDLLNGIVEAMQLNDFKSYGTGWINDEDGWVKISII